MPKATKQTIKAMLAPHGLTFTLINGELGIRESANFRLPPKKATLVFVLGMKPAGSVGRGPPQGYSLQTAMGLSNDHYKVLMEAAWFILQNTNKVDTTKSLKQQEDGVIDLCIKKLLKVHPELDDFKTFGLWAPRATFQLLLRNKSGQANSSTKRLEKLAALIASGQEPPPPQPRKSRGRPRKNPAPAPEGATTTTNEPTVTIQPPLEPGPIAASLHDDASEVFDLNIGGPGSDDMDTSIRQTIQDMSGIQLNDDDLDDDDDDDDDNGQFNMDKVHAAPKLVPVPTASTAALAPPVPTSPAPTASVATPILAVSPAPAAPAAPPSLDAPASPAPASAALTAPVEPPVPTGSPAPAAPVVPSDPPVETASATPPVPTSPPAKSPDSPPASIIWRGRTITPKVMANLKKSAARQAAGKQARCANIYEDLIGKFMENPDYDPSSEPDPVPQVAAEKAVPKGKAKAVPTPEPGLEPNSNVGKGKGKAIDKFTDAPVNIRRSVSPAISVATLPNAQATLADINPAPTSSATGGRTTANTPDIQSGAQPSSHTSVTPVSPSQVENEATQTRSNDLDSQAQITSPSANPTSNPTNSNQSEVVQAPCPATGATASPPSIGPTSVSLILAQEDSQNEQHVAHSNSVLPGLEQTSSAAGSTPGSILAMHTSNPTSKIEVTTPNITPTHAWKCLGDFRGALGRVSGGFGPLKPVLDNLNDFIGIYEDAAKAQQEYVALKSDLEGLFTILSKHFCGDVPPTMTVGMNNLCAAIEDELNKISSKEERGRGRRYVEANIDIQEVMKCYRRIQGHLERLKLNADLSMWKVVDELAAENRLKSLSPSLSACYDSAEAPTVGRRECTPETRKQVLSDLGSWIHNQGHENMYWLNGMAGTGKTTIANSLCAILDQSHELAASFFCSRILPECRKVKLILPIIAYQLARYSRPFYHALSLALQQDRDLHTKVLSSQFAGLIAGPLHKVAGALPACLVVVIDALDECEDSQLVGQLLEILARHASDLPIKVFVSSRPEPQIRQKIGESKSQLILHQLEDSIVKEDIRLYLHTELSDSAAFISDDDFSLLVERAGVFFIYAATIVRYIKSATTNPLRRKRVQGVLGANQPGYSKKNEEIDLLYATVLASAFDSPDLEDAEKATMKLVLDTVVCAQEPLTVNGLAGILGLEDGTWVWAALEPLWSVIHVSGGEGVVTTLHASFADYMFDASRSEAHGCQSQQHHGRLAVLCFERIKKNNLQFNLCGLQSSFGFDNQVSDLEERIRKAIPPDLSYACCYWAAHLVPGDLSDEHVDQLRELLRDRLLLWLEVLNLKNKINASASMLAATREWYNVSGACQEVIELIHDAWRFATTFATHDVVRSTPHLYVSMLASWPSAGPLGDCYIPRTRRLACLQGTGMGRRQLALLTEIVVGRAVDAVAFSLDGMRIVSGSDDATIRVWDATTGKPVIDPLKGHTDKVNSVAFSPDGMRIVSGSEDSTVRLWDATTGQPATNPLEGHTYAVNSVAFSPNGMRVVSGSWDGTIRVWDATTGKPLMGPLKYTPSVDSIAFSPDGMRIASGSGSGNALISVWDPTTGKMVTNLLERHAGSVNSVAFSPDGMRIASGSDDAKIWVWDAMTGETIMDPLEGHTRSVKSVAFSPDGTRIVSGSDDSTVRLWDATTGQPVTDPLEGHDNYVVSVAFSHDSMRIVSGSNDYTIQLWDAMTGKPLMGPLKGHTNSAQSVAFSPDGMRIVSGSSDTTIRVWDTTSGKSVMDPLEGHAHSVKSVAFSPDGTQIVSCSEDSTIQLWDTRSGKQRMDPLRGHMALVNSVAWSPDGRRIASGSNDNTIRVWDATTGKLAMNPLRGHARSVNSVAFSPDGTRIVSGSADTTIRLWDATGDVVGGSYPEIDPGVSFARSVRGISIIASTARSGVTSRDMHIVSGSWDGTIRLWDAMSGKPVMDPLGGHVYSIRSVAFSPDGGRIASGSDDGTIWLWDATTGKSVMDPLKGHTQTVHSVTFSPDGTRIVSGSWDDTIRVWDAMTGKLVMAPLGGHTNRVNSVAFSSDGMRLASASWDCTIRIWDTGTLFSQVKDCEPSQAVCQTWTLDAQGWVRDKQQRLLLWLPVDLRHRLLRPHNPILISTDGSVELDFGDAHLGESWVDCYVPA